MLVFVTKHGRKKKKKKKLQIFYIFIYHTFVEFFVVCLFFYFAVLYGLYFPSKSTSPKSSPPFLLELNVCNRKPEHIAIGVVTMTTIIILSVNVLSEDWPAHEPKPKKKSFLLIHENKDIHRNCYHNNKKKYS